MKKNILLIVMLSVMKISFAQNTEKTIPINDLRKWGVLNVCEMPTDGLKDGDVSIDKILVIDRHGDKKDTITAYQLHFYKMYENKLCDYTFGYWHEDFFDKASYKWLNDTTVSINLISSSIDKIVNMKLVKIGRNTGIMDESVDSDNSTNLKGQNGKEILKISCDKCNEVQSGSYEMMYKLKPMSDKDTFPKNLITDFTKIENDSIFPFKFRYSTKDKPGGVWYTGNEYIDLNKDSTASIAQTSIHAKYIQSIKHNRIFFDPITRTKRFFEHTIFYDSTNEYSYTGIENINNKNYYKIKIVTPAEKQKPGEFTLINNVVFVWVNTETYIPIRYISDMDILNGNDTMHQYMSFELIKFTDNPVFDKDYFTTNAIPKFYIQKDFVPYKHPELLPKDTIAPTWNLVSLDDKKYDLKGFGGKLLMIDFFYKGCGPCMQALPSLEKLYEKYKDKNFALIGIDPYDKKEDDLKTFLAKRGVTYPILMDGKDASKDYRVSGYPTMYFIDKNGKIIATQVGYGEEVDDKLEKIIKEHLE